MRRYSAAEAIGPAWESTTALMWKHRRWQTGLKIAFVAMLAEMGGANFSFSNPAQRTHHLPPGMAAAMIGIAAVFGLIMLVVGLILFYVGSRMQFVHFACIAFRETRIALLWNRYGRLTWRWIGFKLLLFLALLIPIIPIVIVFAKRMPHVAPGAAPPFGPVLTLIGCAFLLLIPFAMIYTAARDFVLPSVALEGTTVRFGIRRFLLWLRAEPGEVMGFLVLRLVLGLVFGIATYIALLFSLAISAIPFAILGLAIWVPFRHAGTGVHLAAALVTGILVLLFVVWMFVLTLAVVGTLVTFYIAWGTYFLGGRYPMLGELLEPSPAIPFTPPPTFPSDDADSGPDLPLNPQPAG